MYAVKMWYGNSLVPPKVHDTLWRPSMLVSQLVSKLVSLFIEWLLLVGEEMDHLFIDRNVIEVMSGI